MSREANAIKYDQLTAGEMGMYSRHLLIPAIGVKGQLAHVQFPLDEPSRTPSTVVP